MMFPAWRTLRLRLWLVIALAILPLLVFILWEYRTKHATQVGLAEAEVRHVMEMAKQAEDAAIERISMLMGIMSRANDLQASDPEQCSGLSKRLLDANPSFANMGAATSDGEVFCTALTSSRVTHVDDRLWFKQALSAPQPMLSKGEYVIGRISGKPGLVFGYPMLRADASQAVLFIALDVNFFKQLLSGFELAPGWEVALQTRDGETLARKTHTGFIENPSRDSELTAALVSMLAEGVRTKEVSGRDQLTRLHGVASLNVINEQVLLTVAAPLHLSITELRTTLWWQLIGLLALTSISACVARWQIYGLIEGWTTRLRSALKRIGEGQPHARMSPPSTLHELAEVERGLNVMAEALDHKGAENQRLLMAIEQSPLSVVITDPSGAIEYVNQRFIDISGYSKEEVIGRNPKILNHGLTPKAIYEDLWSTMSRRETWSGEFINTRKDGSIYTELATIAPVVNPQGQLSHYVAVKEDITARKIASERLDRLSNYDLLTDLPNRRLLKDRIQQATLSTARSNEWAMLLMVDIDRFKLLNDSKGHDAGDRLLQELAHRLQGAVRNADTTARLGDDEFAVVVENLGPEAMVAGQRAEQLAQKIQATLSEPCQLHEGSQILPYHPSLTIGITLFRGTDFGVDDLLKQAEIALHSGKEAGGNQIRFFDAAVQAQIAQRAALEQSLRHAVEQQAFTLYYQPQVSANGKVVGAEALVRWIKPDGSAISPADFIPLAEDCGLIVPLGTWILNAGLEQLRAWSLSPATQDLELSINVSARQFKDPLFVEQVLQSIQRYAVRPDRLLLELTESVILDDLDFVVQRMKKLRAVGIRFSLDDFGTGYSSLAYLKRLPLQQIKIDQGFVRDMLGDSGSQAIVRAILAISEALNVEVVAEGVETEAQRDFLLTNGCDLLQGYLFGRPQPIETCGPWAASAPSSSSS